MFVLNLLLRGEAFLKNINNEFNRYFDEIKTYSDDTLSNCIFNVGILSKMPRYEVVEYVSAMIVGGFAELIDSEQKKGNMDVCNGISNAYADYAKKHIDKPELKVVKNLVAINLDADENVVFDDDDFVNLLSDDQYTSFAEPDDSDDSDDSDDELIIEMSNKAMVMLNDLTFSIVGHNNDIISYLIGSDDILDIIKISIENIRGKDIEDIMTKRNHYFAFDNILLSKALSREVAISLGNVAVIKYENNKFYNEFDAFKEGINQKRRDKIAKEKEKKKNLLSNFKNNVLNTFRSGYFLDKVGKQSENSICIFNDEFIRNELSSMLDKEDFGSLSGSEKTGIAEYFFESCHLMKEIPIVSACKDSAESFKQLIIDYPNFKAVSLYVKDYVDYSLSRKRPFSMPNILLTGGPGIGKSDYVIELSKVIGIYNEFISMSSLSNGSELSGLTAKWGTGSPGQIFDAISHSSIANPLIVLDELDKTAGTYGNSVSPCSVLLSLTEKKTAEKFRESFFNMEVDFSHINWIGTANDLWDVPQALLSRFKKFPILSPKKEDMPIIFENMYKSILQKEGLCEEFTEKLSDGVVKELSKLSLRAAKDCIERGIIKSVISNLKLNEKYRILPSQLG